MLWRAAATTLLLWRPWRAIAALLDTAPEFVVDDSKLRLDDLDALALPWLGSALVRLVLLLPLRAAPAQHTAILFVAHHLVQRSVRPVLAARRRYALLVEPRRDPTDRDALR